MAAVFALGLSVEVSAQGLKDILGTVGNVVSAVTGNTTNENSIQGTWNYVSPAVKFESDNMLASAGGAVASATVKGKLDKYYRKAGIKPGACTFVFNADKTFSVTIAGKTTSGTYELDSEKGTVALTFKAAGMRIATFNANIYKTSGNLALAFTARQTFGSGENRCHQSPVCRIFGCRRFFARQLQRYVGGIRVRQIIFRR